MKIGSYFQFTIGLFVVLSATSAKAATFQGLGGLDPMNVYSVATGISADGTTIIGQSQTSEGVSRAFRWTSGDGMQVFADVSVTAISGDGQVIVGNTIAGDHAPYRWTEASGFELLTYSCDVFAPTWIHDVSDDGEVVVARYSGAPLPPECEGHSGINGGCWPGIHNYPHTLQWSEGTITGGGPPGPAGISADGTIIVGTETTITPQGVWPPSYPVRWSADEGSEYLQTLDSEYGDEYGAANGVSADGSTVIGESLLPWISGPRGVRWANSAEAVPLAGDLPWSSSPTDVSGDGSVIIGRWNYEGTTGNFYWDEAQGMRDLVDVLAGELGLVEQLANWQLTDATAISADGLTIVGNGINPDGDVEAWIATLAPLVTLPGDFNGDGRVSAADYTVLRNGMGAIYTQADYDTWKAHYGETITSASAAFEDSLAVLEPDSLVLLTLAGLFVMWRRRTGVG